MKYITKALHGWLENFEREYDDLLKDEFVEVLRIDFYNYGNAYKYVVTYKTLK